MKILMDECLPPDFRHCFPGHDVHSIQFAGLNGPKKLLDTATSFGTLAVMVYQLFISEEAREQLRALADELRKNIGYRLHLLQ